MAALHRLTGPRYCKVPVWPHCTNSLALVTGRCQYGRTAQTHWPSLLEGASMAALHRLTGTIAHSQDLDQAHINKTSKLYMPSHWDISHSPEAGSLSIPPTPIHPPYHYHYKCTHLHMQAVDRTLYSVITDMPGKGWV
ncbi:Hypothetical predicted protein [Pelobates cultripes]|uniref:Uncharacterized protein n=1 Tax=Pelobates cultripes TaxID=61616 RepID=A0AAD1SN84_PELCU|nr:Hypothetical predicted protein [Pelobates cultripes]